MTTGRAVPKLALRLLHGALQGCLLFLLLAFVVLQARAADAAALRSRYAQLDVQLRSSPFQRPLHIDSDAGEHTLRGDVYAVLEHPFAKVSQALVEPARWCDILILPFNTKSCHAVDKGGKSGLAVRIGRKYDQPLERAFQIDFDYARLAATSDYFESHLQAKEGPFGTRDYRIAVSGIPLDRTRTFLHLSYSYGYGFAGRLAMRGYLATVGARKVGFTITARDPDGRPHYIGGLRGAVERNAMRYYLAIDSYLASLGLPRDTQVEHRLQRWFTETERYPLQLHEMDRLTYVAMKRHEYQRQQASMTQ